jgi:hypothetical protein
MTNTGSDAVIAYSQVKQAALYFPHVVPLPFFIIEDLFLEAAWEYKRHGRMSGDFEQKFSGQIPDKQSTWLRLLPPRLSSDGKFFRLLHKFSVWDGIHSGIMSLVDTFGTADDIPETKARLQEILKKHLRVNFFHEQSLEKTFDHLVGHYRLYEFPALFPENWETQSSDGDSGPQDFRITLINIELVDPSTATWDQICAFKEDGESQKKLQRLRRFFLKNYSGLSKEQIADDLQTRLDDHAAVVRKFGFDVKQTMLEAVSSSKPLQSGLGGALIAAFYEQPWTAVVSGAAGILLDVGNTALKLRQQRFEFRESIEQHPLGYIITATEQLAAKNQT